ncbi:MAG: gliding motility-associated C-terminal domain-containing protein [Spirosomataceae bacterium]
MRFTSKIKPFFGCALGIWFWVVGAQPAVCQNLVPNGGFETFKNCPTQDNLLKEAVPWFNPNKATPDFYHRCMGNVPQMVLPPRSGDGMARLFWDLNWGEYLEIPLTEPLDSSACYFFEMYAALESPQKYTAQTLGATFFKDPWTVQTTGLIGVDPQILDYQLNNATKPLQWEPIVGYVKPKGGERYLLIGSFNKLPPFLGFHYLFIDDVSLRKIKVDLGRDTTLCGRSSTLLLNAETPGATSYRWQDGSTSPTFLVTKPGKYWVSATTQCKMVTDTIKVDYILDFDLGADTTLCNGQKMTLLTPQGATKYRWQDGSSRNTFEVNKAGRYSVQIEKLGCIVRDSIQVNYIPPPKLSLGGNVALCIGETLTLQPRYSDGTFSWADQFPKSDRLVTAKGKFIATVINACGLAKDSVEVQYRACGCVIYAPDVFTPNQDGINEYFQPLAGCSDLTINSLTIFNRWGEVIFQTNSAPFQWDGRFNETICQTDSYVWSINYTLVTNGETILQKKQGAVLLIR